MKDYRTMGRNCDGNNMDTVLCMQRGRWLVKKGRHLNLRSGKKLSIKKKHTVYVGAAKRRLWPHFML